MDLSNLWYVIAAGVIFFGGIWLIQRLRRIRPARLLVAGAFVGLVFLFFGGVIVPMLLNGGEEDHAGVDCSSIRPEARTTEACDGPTETTPTIPPRTVTEPPDEPDPDPPSERRRDERPEQPERPPQRERPARRSQTQSPSAQPAPVEAQDTAPAPAQPPARRVRAPQRSTERTESASSNSSAQERREVREAVDDPQIGGELLTSTNP